MLNDFSWNMTGYIPKHAVNPSDDGIPPYVAERIFQLEPEPPTVDNPNEYILSALREKDLKYFSFFLHHYELQLNKRIKTFLGVDGGNRYDTDRFLDIKLSCREQMLQKLMDYDPAKGAEYATYIFPFIRDAMLRFRMGEEKWSVSSLTNYKMVRSMAWLYHNTKDAVSEFAKKYNCDLALAEGYLKVVRGIRNQQPFYVTDEDGEETGEDVALDDTWNYTDILWNGIQAEKVQRAFEKLNYREQTLLEKRLAICTYVFLNMLFLDKHRNFFPLSPKETVLLKYAGTSSSKEYFKVSPLNFWTKISFFVSVSQTAAKQS